MSVKSFRQLEVALDSSDVPERTAASSTLSELIATIPRAYQAVLGDHLTKKYRAAHKHANVQSTISMYERHLREHSFPPIIRNALKEPKLQFAKEFLGTTHGSEAPTVFQKNVMEARTAVLKCALQQKQSELAHLATLIASDERGWMSLCDTTCERIASNSGGRAEPGPGGVLKITGGPQTATTEYLTMRGACQTYVYRVLALARAASDRAEIQKIAKMQLKDSDDVEMTGISKEPAVADIVNEQLNKRLRAIESRLPKPNGKPRNAANRVQKKPTGKKNGGKNGNKRKAKKSR